jgi:hypothetical protein
VLVSPLVNASRVGQIVRVWWVTYFLMLSASAAIMIWSTRGRSVKSVWWIAIGEAATLSLLSSFIVGSPDGAALVGIGSLCALAALLTIDRAMRPARRE